MPDPPSPDPAMPTEGGGASVPAAGPIDWRQPLDHVRQLVRAGLPLPGSLRLASNQASTRAAAATFAQMAERIERGESLSDAIAASDLPIQEPLAAVLEAGTATGDLWTVLDPLLETAAIAETLRHSYTRLMRYYLACIAIGAILIGLVLGGSVGTIDRSTAGLIGPASPSDPPSVERAFYVVPLLLAPIGLVVLAAVDWGRRLRAPHRLPLDFLPPMSRLARRLGWYRWAATLRSLIAAEIPLPRSLRIAGRAAIDGRIDRISDSLAEQTEAGRPLSEVALTHDMPLLLRSLLGASSPIPLDAALDEATTFLAETLHVRATRTQQTLRVALMLIMGIGLFGYAMLIVSPLDSMYSLLTAA